LLRGGNTVKWRKFLAVVVYGLCTVASSQVRADSLDLNLNDDMLRLVYEADLKTGMSMDLGYFYNDTHKKDRSDADLMHLGLYVTGDNWSQSGVFNIKVGGRLIYTNIDPSYDLMALGLGGEVRFSPVHRLGIGASAFYAPRIASFMDAERYSEYGVKLDYQLLTQAFVYLGYRQIDVEVENISRKVELDDSGHVGLKLLF